MHKITDSLSSFAPDISALTVSSGVADALTAFQDQQDVIKDPIVSFSTGFPGLKINDESSKTVQNSDYQLKSKTLYSQEKLTGKKAETGRIEQVIYQVASESKKRDKHNKFEIITLIT